MLRRWGGGFALARAELCGTPPRLGGAVMDVNWTLAWFDRWVGSVLRYRFVWLFGITAVTLGLGYLALDLPLLTTLRDILPPTTPGMATYEPARARFGGDEAAYLVVEAEDHFTDGGLARLEAFTAAVAAHPFVERVVSPTRAQEMWAEGDELFIDRFARAGRAPAAVLKALRSDPVFARHLVSADGRFAMVVARAVPSTETVGQRRELQAAVRARTQHLPERFRRYRGENQARRLLEIAKQGLGTELVDLAVQSGYRAEQVHAIGFTPILAQLLREARENLSRLFPFAILVMWVAMWIVLRRPLDAMLPILCVIPAVVWAVALGGLLFGRLTLMSTIAPIMVLVVGVSDVVHLITQYRKERDDGIDHDRAIRRAFRKVGIACVMTSVTTLIGFGSMLFLPLPTSQELGVTAGIGVVAAFLLSFVLTPIALSLLPPRWRDGLPGGVRWHRGSVLARGLRALGRLFQNRGRARAIAVVGVLFTLLSGLWLAQQRVENSLRHKLRPGHALRLSVEKIREALKSTGDVELLLFAEDAGAFKRPEVVRAVARLSEAIEREATVLETWSYLDVLKTLHAVMAPELAKVRPLPDERQEMVAQYLFLFELSGGDDLDPFIDDGQQHARIVVRGNDATAEEVMAAADRYDQLAREILPPGIRGETNGIGLLAARLGPVVLASTVQGFAGALLVIAFLMAVLFRSVRIGLLSLLPNLLPVAAGLGAIPLFFEQLDIDALIFVPVCVGIAVDDTIHFLARYRLERAEHSGAEAVARTLMESGHGIVRSSVILGAGFLVLLLADYQPIAVVGFLLPLCIGAAVVMDLVVVPAMARLGWFDVR